MEQIERTFMGRVLSINENVAHVWLTENDGSQYEATCDSIHLTEAGLKEGQDFIFDFSKKAEEERSSIRPFVPRRLTPEEIEEADKRMKEIFGEFNEEDGY